MFQKQKPENINIVKETQNILRDFQYCVFKIHKVVHQISRTTCASITP